MKKINLPTKITIARIGLSVLLIFAIVILYFLDQFKVFSIAEVGNITLNNSGATINWIMIVLMLVFLFASLTDFLDGYLARKYQLVTDLGKFLDPIADKFLVDSALILLSTKMDANGNFLLFPVITILFIGRDLIIDGLRMIAARKNITLAANKYGKAKTIMQMIIIPIIFLNGFPFNYFDLQGLGNFEYTYIITNILGCLALIISLVSLIIYLI